MAVKNVLLIGNPLLRQISSEVTEFSTEVMDMIGDLKDTLYYLQDQYKMGRALAAPQIGNFKQIIYYRVGNVKKILINPKIISKSDSIIEVWDSCYSFKLAFFVKVKRHKTISVDYQDEKGQHHNGLFEDDLSELFQHEVDHLHGKLAVDYLENKEDLIMREEFEKIVDAGTAYNSV
ncbi:MAG: peptide deformylase [Spirochaetota bacterium]|nr:MAG: peptide deformylase [Spirochaetota bacterium]